jgi:hypothetical protein
MPEEDRAAILAARKVGRDEAIGYYLLEEGSYGDLIGSMLWRAMSRGFPAWMFACPIVTQGVGGKGDIGIASPGGGGDNPYLAAAGVKAKSGGKGGANFPYSSAGWQPIKGGPISPQGDKINLIKSGPIVVTVVNGLHVTAPVKQAPFGVAHPPSPK